MEIMSDEVRSCFINLVFHQFNFLAKLGNGVATTWYHSDPRVVSFSGIFQFLARLGNGVATTWYHSYPRVVSFSGIFQIVGKTRK